MMKTVQLWLMVSYMRLILYEAHMNSVYCYIGDRTWKTDGCNTTLISDNVVECYCNHMTPFAVLLVSSEISIHEINSVKVALQNNSYL